MNKFSDNFDQAHQYYPTYSFTNRDIALLEYESAVRTLESEERIYLVAQNIVLTAVAGIGSLVVGFYDNISRSLTNIFGADSPDFYFLVFIWTLSWVTVRQFAHRQHHIVTASRKVVVLRRMLGLRYRSIRMVLPNWRIEGADEPFSLRLFLGWLSPNSFPFHVVGIASCSLTFVICSRMASLGSGLLPTNFVLLYQQPFIVSVCWLLFVACSYRFTLLDHHESMWLLISRQLARVIHLRVEKNFEYILYRARLGTFELKRLRVDLSSLKIILVSVEDEQFFKHPGISIHGVTRAILRKIRLKRNGGGSTITQQIVRTLFIVDLHKTVRRKLIEICFALWFSRRNNNKELELELYLASVRFENRVYGVIDAMQHFFGETLRNPSKAQSFFLIERVSNVRARFMSGKVLSTLKRLREKEVLDKVEVEEIGRIYANMIGRGKVSDIDNRLPFFLDSLRNI